MSEYVTYKLWDGCTAPNNLEFNGRLRGERVADMVTLAVPDDCGKYYCTECGYYFRYKKDAQTFNYCPMCAHRIVKG